MKRIACCLSLFALTLLVTACGPQAQSGAPRFQLTDVTGAPFGKSLALTDHTGKPRTLTDFQGKVIVLFFGFTQCPDICPTTLAEMAKVVKDLGPDGSKVQVLFVSVDPERDTAALLSQYVTTFNPDFLGLRGDAEATQRAAKEFKVYVQKQPAKNGSNGNYSVDHSAGTFVLDQRGQLRLFAQHNSGSQALIGDIRTLLKAG